MNLAVDRMFVYSVGSDFVNTLDTGIKPGTINVAKIGYLLSLLFR